MPESSESQTAAPPRWMSSGNVYLKAEEVDEEAGVIRGAAVVTAGEALGHGVWLEKEFLNDTAKLGNERQHGIKVRFGHPNMSSTALGTFLGRAKNFRVTGDAVRADIFLSNEAKETPHGNLYDYTLGMAANEPDMFGQSIVFTPGRSYRRTGKGAKVYRPSYDDSREERDKQREEWDKAGPKTFVEIAKLHATDMVDSPAANPDGLFSQWSADTLAGQVSEFLDTHPQVMDLLNNKPEIMAEFMARYDAYKARQEEGQTEMPDESTIETTDADALETTEDTEALEAAEPAEDTAPPAESDAEAALAAEAEDADTDLADDPRELFAAMVTEFGLDIAAEVFANGGGYDEAREIYAERVVEENRQLRADLADLQQAAAGEEKPATFADADAPPATPAPTRALSARERVAAQIKSEINK